MYYIILILIVFILINTALKLSFWKLWQSLMFGAAVALFVYLVYPAATKLSKTELDAMIQTPAIMQNMAVVITLETLVFFAFAFMALRQFFGKKVKKYLFVPLRFYPGLLLFPTAFFVLGELFFAFPGVDFERTAYIQAGVLFILIPLMAYGFKTLLKDADFRLELLFITNLFTCIFGLISTVNGNMVYRSVNQTTDLRILLPILGVCVLLFAAGFVFYKYKKLKI